MRPSAVSLVLACLVACAPLRGQQDRDQLADSAQAALQSKDWPGAAAALEKLARLEPAIPEVHANLGLAYYSMGRVPEAERSFEQALRLNPRTPGARTMLGLCKAELGKTDEAIRILDPAFRHASEPELGRLVGLSLQKAYARAGRYPDASGVLEELLRRFPNDPEILFHASSMYADRSYEITTRLVEEAPDSAWTHYLRGQVQESLKRYDLAREEYRAVLEKNPGLPGAHLRFAKATLLSSSEPAMREEATKALEKELAISPWNADAEFELGEIFRERGDLDTALVHFSNAVRDHPGFFEARLGLARTLLKRNKPQQAALHLEEAVKLRPGDKSARFLLASAYKSMGEDTRYRKALAEYRKLQAGSSGEEPQP